MTSKKTGKAAAPALKTEGFVLSRVAAGESHMRLALLSAKNGRLMCLQRLSKKTPGDNAQLFDLAQCVLEGPKESGFYFVKEYHAARRHEGIGKSYAALTCASVLAEILERNSRDAPEARAFFKLAHTAFEAWDSAPHPHAAFLKILALLADHEGYPLREPLAEQSVPDKEAQLLVEKLKHWLKTDTDIWMP